MLRGEAQIQILLGGYGKQLYECFSLDEQGLLEFAREKGEFLAWDE